MLHDILCRRKVNEVKWSFMKISERKTPEVARCGRPGSGRYVGRRKKKRATCRHCTRLYATVPLSPLQIIAWGGASIFLDLARAIDLHEVASGVGVEMLDRAVRGVESEVGGGRLYVVPGRK
jgi:hypothetical protein